MIRLFLRRGMQAVVVFLLLSASLYAALTYGVDTLSQNMALAIATSGSFIIALLFFVMETALSRPHRIDGDAVGELAASPELFRELFKNSPVPYLLVNERGAIEYSNKSALRLFQVKADELHGINAFNILEGEDKDHILLIPAKLSKGISIENEEVQIVRNDNSRRWVSLAAFPFVDHGAQKALLTLVDITKQKEIDQAKTEFVSLASHQLRTPISSIKWNVELLSSKKSGTLTERQQSYVEKIDRGVHRMDALIQDFLNVSKLELGTYAVQKKQISLHSIVEIALKEQSEKIETKGITVNVSLDQAVDRLIADQSLMLMIVGNIISNAVKYTPEGGSIAIESGGNERRITISIRDSGVGIPKDEQEKLFTKLFRASNVRESIPDGTGLGLYIVERSVMLLGGEISVASEENVGTAFTIVLPR